MLAEPELKQFSERLLEDLPGHLASGEHLQQVPFNADGYQSPQPPNNSLSMVTLANIDEKPTKGANSLLPGTRSGVACQLVLDGNFRERLLAFF